MMMQKQKSPPKHRHDGTSPLPLGMDWSPAPKKWDGRATVWPHDAHTGWSYCVTIPSWIILPKSRDAEGIVFYSVQVGIQSPEGDSTSRGVLRRFSDFMRLSTELKRAFPKKNLPPAPPKHVLRINSSRSLPEERRFALEEWMGRLLSDIDLSRSVPVASFLELEAAARSLFHDINQQTLEGDLSGQSVGSLRQSSGVSILASTSSITPDYVSDAYETSELGTPRQGRDNSSETGTEDLELDQDLSGPRELTYNTSNDDGGLFMGGNILDERFPTRKVHSRKERGVTGRDVDNGNSSKTSYFLGGNMDSPSKSDNGKSENGRFSHARKLSSESAGSDISSIKGSNLSITGLANSLGDSSTEFAGGAEVSTSIGILGREGLQFPDDIQVVLPLDQRHKMNRVLLTMQRRLATAKTDMEDLIARLNQEIAVKEYLTTKVKDLEVELETSKQKSKENLQQAILVERERFTQMQWDMEELRRKSLEMEWRLKSEEEEKDRTESTKTCALQEKDMLLQELDSTKQKLVSLQKVHEELLLKSKADTKVLVKEVKSLRNSQSELKQELGQSLKERSELEAAIQNEKQRTKHAKNARAKLLHECEVLRTRLQECSVNLFEEDEDKFSVDSSSLSDALDLLTTSDNRIGFLLAEAQLLAEYDEDTGVSPSRSQRITGENLESVDYQTRKMLTDLFVDNAKLRKQVNSVIRCAIKTTVKSEKEKEEQEEKEEVPSRKTVLNKFLDR